MTSQSPLFSPMVQGYWRMQQWQRSSQQHETFIKQCLELGIYTVDHAAVYGAGQCEEAFGKALALDAGLRDQLTIISKCGIVGPAQEGPFSERTVAHYDSGREQIIRSTERSLSRLGIECLDVLLLHRPDYLMDADEVADTFSELKSAGKVKSFGVSNFTASQFELLQSRLDEPLVTNQIEVSPLHIDALDNGTLNQLQRLNVRPMAWSCLGGGQLFSGASDKAVRLRSVITEVAEEIGASSIEQVAYLFVLSLPSKPVPVIGSGNIDRVRLAVESMALNMTREQWYRIWGASVGHGVA